MMCYPTQGSNIVLAPAVTGTNTQLKKVGLVFISQKYPETFLASRLGFWAQLQVEQSEKRAHTMNHRSNFSIIHRQRSSGFSQKYQEWESRKFWSGIWGPANP